MKHIAVLYMSTFTQNETEFQNDDGTFKEITFQTNETALKYLSWKLAKNGEAMDKVFAFVSHQAEFSGAPKDGIGKGISAYNWLKYSLEKYHQQLDSNNGLIIRRKIDDWFEKVEVGNGDVFDSYVSLNKMAIALQNYVVAQCGEEITFHIDFTGGFRHSAVLLLSLVHMMKFSGMKIDNVIYSNMGTKKIEDIRSLLDSYTMISGAAEFTNYGSIEQISKIFHNVDNKSEQLKSLLDSMEDFSETLKVCARKEDLKRAMDKLRVSLKEYRSEINKIGDIGIDALSFQEQFFLKLLPIIENEYANILSEIGGVKTSEIIKWCVRKGLLQQALVIYSEWLPERIISKLKFKNNNIENICKSRNNLDWVSWQQYLLKSYIPVQWVGEEVTLKDLRRLLDEGPEDDSAEYLSLLKDKLFKNKEHTERLIKLLKEIINLTSGKDKDAILNGVDKLNINDPLFVILKEKALEKEIKTYLEGRLTSKNDKLKIIKKDEDKIRYILLSDIKSISNDRLEDILGLPIGNENDAKARGLVFKHLFDKEEIDFQRKKNKNLKFMDKKMIVQNTVALVTEYNTVVDEWRNTTSHAIASTNGRETSERIKDTLLDSLNKLDSL